jgi:phage shock protein PspC (stress-responsive transcriptional regulator)
MVAGAAAGLARYLGVDVMIVPSISPPTWVPQMCV